MADKAAYSDTEYVAPYGAYELSGQRNYKYSAPTELKHPGCGPDMSKSGGQFSIEMMIL